MKDIPAIVTSEPVPDPHIQDAAVTSTTSTDTTTGKISKQKKRKRHISMNKERQRLVKKARMTVQKSVKSTRNKFFEHSDGQYYTDVLLRKLALQNEENSKQGHAPQTISVKAMNVLHDFVPLATL